MATLELKRTEIERQWRNVASGGLSRPVGWLGVALLGVATYAIFAHGAIQAPAEPRIQVALAVLVAAVTGTALWTGALGLAAPRMALIGLALLVVFAAWMAVTLAWSVSPDLTWTEFNRTVAYALVLGLAMVFGASAPNATELVARAFLALTMVATLYALGQKLIPGLHLAGLINLDQTGRTARVQEPLGYWNAFALLLAMAAPTALALSVRPAGGRRARLLAAASLQLILVTAGFTDSRGGLLALLIGLIASIALSGAALRMLLWAAVAGLGAVPPLVLGVLSHSLSANGVALGPRESAGVWLGIVLASCLTALRLAGARLLKTEEALTLSAKARRRIVRVSRRGAAGALVLGLAALALSSRGLTGTISSDSANRWGWWNEAVGAFWSRPFGGWGAGSFPVVDLLYRHDTLSVAHAHSVPLQWLAETGLIGTLLAMGAWLLLLRTGLASVRDRLRPEHRLLAAALLAGALAYSLHSLYDRDWDIPGVTIPVLVLLGTLAGSLRASGASDVAVPSGVPPRSRPGLRLLGLAISTFGLCVYSLSAVLPSLAANRAADAFIAAGKSTPASLAAAQRDANVAIRLDPFSDAGVEAAASIALQRNDRPLARLYLLQAVRREPADAGAWRELAAVDLQAGDLRQALVAGQRTLDLDPRAVDRNGAVERIAQQISARLAPATGSATARATP